MSQRPQNFNELYRKHNNYYSQPSDGLIACIARYNLDPCPALDAGCGQGRNSLWLAENGFRVLALDISQRAIQALQERATNLGLPVEAKVADISNFEFPIAAFGLIVLQTTLNHIDPVAIPPVCEHISSALAPGGILYCVAFTTEDPGFSGQGGMASDCANLVKYYFPPNGLRNSFPNIPILEYEEYTKPDLTHGAPHIHGKAKLIARAG